MTNILQIATLFLAELGFGSALILPFFPLKTAGKSFVRFYYGFICVILGLFLICLYRLQGLHLNYLILIAPALWIWGLSCQKTFTPLEQGLIWFYSLVSLGILFIYPQKFIFHGLTVLAYVPRFTQLLVSTVFLSLSLMNMIFGHWYLVNRKLPIESLIKTCRALIGITYVRVLSVGIATLLAYQTLPKKNFSRLIDFMGHGVFFWARVLAGLGIPLVVAHLAYQSARIKSNQSATGIMYAGMVFVLMGEIMGLYLYTLTGILF